MTLEELGYNKKIEAFRIEQKRNDFEIGRIIAEHKERYSVKTTHGEIERNSHENYMKLEREKVHFESTVAEKRNKDKEFGKMQKNYKKDISKNKY